MIWSSVIQWPVIKSITGFYITVTDVQISSVRLLADKTKVLWECYITVHVLSPTIKWHWCRLIFLLLYHIKWHKTRSTVFTLVPSALHTDRTVNLGVPSVLLCFSETWWDWEWKVQVPCNVTLRFKFNAVLLGRLPKVDLIILERGKNVRPSVRPSVHKKFLRFEWNLVCR